MASQSKNNNKYFSKYDILIIALIAGCIVFAIVLWVWYGYKDAQIDKEISNIK